MSAQQTIRVGSVRLAYVDDRMPGCSRASAGPKAGGGWAYRDAQGKRITDRSEIDRLNSIALPPAYRDAWFCPSPDGHILAESASIQSWGVPAVRLAVRPHKSIPAPLSLSQHFRS